MNSEDYLSLFFFLLFAAIAHLSSYVACDELDVNTISQEDGPEPIITPISLPSFMLAQMRTTLAMKLDEKERLNKAITTLRLWDSPLVTPAHRTAEFRQRFLEEHGISEVAASSAIQLLTLQLLDMREVIKKDAKSRAPKSRRMENLPSPTLECVSINYDSYDTR